MTTLREAAQMALEALESRAATREMHYHIITALRTALAEPVPLTDEDLGPLSPAMTPEEAIEALNRPEPVAWGMPCPDGQIVDVITPEEHERREGKYTVPLYAEFVCSTGMCRYRKPLMDAEIDAVMPYCHNEFDLRDYREFARAIERAHGIGGKA